MDSLLFLYLFKVVVLDDLRLFRESADYGLEFRVRKLPRNHQLVVLVDTFTVVFDVVDVVVFADFFVSSVLPTLDLSHAVFKTNELVADVAELVFVPVSDLLVVFHEVVSGE